MGQWAIRMTDNNWLVVIRGAATLSGCSFCSGDTRQKISLYQAKPASSPFKLEIKVDPFHLSHPGEVTELQFSVTAVFLNLKNSKLLLVGQKIFKTANILQ